MDVTSAQKKSIDANIILQALVAYFQQKYDPKSSPNWIDLKSIPNPKDD